MYFSEFIRIFKKILTVLKMLLKKTFKKIRQFDMKSCYKNISKIYNIQFTFQNLKKIQKRKKIQNE